MQRIDELRNSARMGEVRELLAGDEGCKASGLVARWDRTPVLWFSELPKVTLATEHTAEAEKVLAWRKEIERDWVILHVGDVQVSTRVVPREFAVRLKALIEDDAQAG